MEEATQIITDIRTWLARQLALLGFSLPLSAWGDSAREVIYSVLTASFVMNVLALVFPLALLQVYDRIIPNQSISTLVWLVVAVMTALLLSGFLKVIRTYVGAWADARFEHFIGCAAFKQILECKLADYEREGSGSHLKRLTALQTLKNFYAGQALISLVDVPFIFVFFLLIAYISGWLVIVPIAVVALVCYSTISHTVFLQGIFEMRKNHDDRRLNFIVETISKIHTIKSNTMEAQMLRRFERLQRTSSVYDYEILHQNSGLTLDSITLSQLAVVLVVAFGSTMVFDGSLTVGALSACTLLAGRCLQPVSSVISMWSRLQLTKIAYEELKSILAIPSEVGPQLKLVTIESGKIVFENVEFRYLGAKQPLLKEINLTVMPNETIGLSGEGLSGKSTLLSLILKLVEPQKGRILIDDQDIALLDPKGLREKIGYMPAKSSLFQGTLLENLTMFNPEYEAQAKSLCHDLGIAKFVEAFPDGYETEVGSQSVETLPRGIMQRIFIVRAIVHNPKIILFDEANTSVDMVGGEKIIELLKSLQKEHTLIIVSHRPSVLALATRCYVIENGTLRQTR